MCSYWTWVYWIRLREILLSFNGTTFQQLVVWNNLLEAHHTHSVHPPPPFLLGGRGRGFSLRPIFQKGGLDRISIFRVGLLGRRRTTLFRESCSFYIKNKLKSQIFNNKKSLSSKMFFSVTTKNLIEEILTKNLVTFKKWDEIKDEIF